jgi:rSAM/selenodomain-associated transferase 2
MAHQPPKISIIVPVLNEAGAIGDALGPLKHDNVEVIVVDGGSSDETLDIVNRYPCRVMGSTKGRASQMNKGAEAASGDILLFLHADTILPESFTSYLQSDFWLSDRSWGRFDVRLGGEQPSFRVIEWFMNNRSRLTGVCTGDQAIFARREAFEKVGGYALIPLMEDIELSKSLKKISPPFCVDTKLTTSSRRWESNGIVRTILLMWKLRLMYFAGVKGNALEKQYGRSPAPF